MLKFYAAVVEAVRVTPHLQITTESTSGRPRVDLRSQAGGAEVFVALHQTAALGASRSTRVMPCRSARDRPEERGHRRRRSVSRIIRSVRIGSREVKLTNLDKIFFPESGLTKGDLIRYYLDVAPQVLNWAKARPMQTKRYPDGVDGFFFYQEESTLQKEHTSADTGGRRCPEDLRLSPLPTSSLIRCSSGTRRAL